MYLFLALLGLHCYAWAFSSCSKQVQAGANQQAGVGVWASHCRGFSHWGAQALGGTGFSNCGAQA